MLMHFTTAAGGARESIMLWFPYLPMTALPLPADLSCGQRR